MAEVADFEAQLAALREQYASQLGKTLDDLTRLAAEKGPNIQRATLAELQARLHKLAGSGGTFGFAELSRQARILEVTVQDWFDSATVPQPDQWAAWRNGLLALRQTLSPSASGIVRAEMPSSPHGQKGNVRIALIEDDQELGTNLQRGLSQFGYEVAFYPGFVEAETAILTEPPDVLVVDIMLTGEKISDGTEGVSSLVARLGHSLPVIFMTARTDFQAKLAAARVGGDAFLVKPVDAPTIAGHIERLLREREQPPYRVLIVDDDEVLAEHYRLVLAAAGILAEKICRPEDTLKAMESLNPDLVLMDLHMPGYSGAELARSIRYDDTRQSLPIVYLSAESGLDQQIAALGSGADDFLTKPISALQLVAAVRARAARARKLSELMSQDSLTGLLKHASFKSRLAQEVDRAQRQGESLAVAMVDMDHFKQVNDTWGHPMGDQVIKTLGHLLRQRLRRQDSIGRYGGEEFAAALPGCTLADALRLLDDVRQRFSEVHFIHEGERFNVTLSVGIASSEQFQDAGALLAAADAALYEAKHSGRNRVCTTTTKKHIADEC